MGGGPTGRDRGHLSCRVAYGTRLPRRPAEGAVENETETVEWRDERCISSSQYEIVLNKGPLEYGRE